ncbi:hypothetical protein [Brachybacterium sp. AOP29-B2-41]|uniref:hypothetical protein n=1 Tax=Brachybacterium sp. AOP29-B2-41 TaxID=3457704 RepID=UPI004033FB34
MTPRRLPLTTPRPDALARRGVLLAGPALLLAGCGLLPSGEKLLPFGEEDEAPSAAAEGVEDVEGEAGAELAADPATLATLDLTAVEVMNEVTAGGLMTRLKDSATLLHPFAQVTVTATALLDSLTAEQYTALTGEEPPTADGADPYGDAPPATTLLPGELKKFLLASWESTDSSWKPEPTGTSTELRVTHEGNDSIRMDRVSRGDTERSGIVLAIVDASPAPSAAAIRATIKGGSQEISLIDGTIVSTPAPRMYERGLEVQISGSVTLDTQVPDGFGQDFMTLRGTVDEAYLTPYVNAGLDYGGNLGWASEDEIHLVIPLSWQRDSSSNVKDLTEVRLVLPDGTDLRPAQDQSTMFGSLGDFIATFTIPVALEAATLEIMPRFGQVLNEEFEQVEETLTATLTFG